MPTPDAETPNIFAKSEELLEMVRKGKEFTDQLMKENERLRYRAVHLEKEILDLRSRATNSDLGPVLNENVQLKEKLGLLEKRFTEVEEENHDFATKYLEISQQNESLANLYVASHQLHSTLDPTEVMEIVKEIVINLIGSEEFVIFLVERKTREIVPVAGEGIFHNIVSRSQPLDTTLLQRVVNSGQPYFFDSARGEAPGDGIPLACVPLKIKKDVVGLIALFRLLSQKSGFTAMDSEILNLLAGHAATAIVSSRLYADADRKIKTIEGFIELLKPQ